jgi:hypothetical protein
MGTTNKKSFLDEAEDLGSATGNESEQSVFSNSIDLGKAEEGSASEVSDEELSTFQKTLNVIDIPASLARTGVEAAFSSKRDVLPELGKQFGRIMESPTTAAMKAPRGIDVNETLITDVMGEAPEQREAIRQEYPITQKAISEIAGFVTENVLDPFTAVGMLPKTRRIINAPLTSVADRQAAKALSQYAGKSDVITKGKDLVMAGKRLVAEDLQGMLRNPAKLYEKLSGKIKITKTAPDSLNTLRIKKGPRQVGKIGEISEGVSSVINKVQDASPELKNKPYGLDTLLTVVRSNVQKSQSKISGETVDVDRIGEILNRTLKPFEDISSGVREMPYVKKSPGSLELEESVKLVQGQPQRRVSTLSLSELQELRKNVGKLVSDRTFYAKADQNVKLESDVLAEMYRELGKVIKSDLDGKKVRLGNEVIDAGEFYETQNNRMKQLMDVQSLLEFTPTEALKQSDVLATIMSMVSQGGVMGATSILGEGLGIPYSSSIGLMGAGLGMSATAGKAVKEAAPEYLSSIFATAAKVPPTVYPRGVIQYMREGKPVSEFGREPQSIEFTPREIIDFKIPRSTDAIVQNKDKVLAKFVQKGIPDEMIETVTMALNGDADDIANIMPLIMTQMPDMFEKSKYKVFDGKFLDPNDKAKAADSISKRDDLSSIERAKMINKINRNNEVPEGL